MKPKKDALKSKTIKAYVRERLQGYRLRQSRREALRRHEETGKPIQLRLWDEPE